MTCKGEKLALSSPISLLFLRYGEKGTEWEEGMFYQPGLLILKIQLDVRKHQPCLSRLAASVWVILLLWFGEGVWLVWHD